MSLAVLYFCFYFRLAEIPNQNNIKSFGITETLLSTTTPNSFLQIRGYNFERKDRIKTGRGIAVYIKEGINYLRQNNPECDEIEAIWFEILVERQNSFLIEIMYQPLNTSKHLHKNFEQKLADILNNISPLNKETIIIKDLNCNNLDNKNNVSIKDAFKLHGYKQIIKTATRITKDSSTIIRHYSRAIWTLFDRFWVHVIWVPKLRICIHMCEREIKILCKL